MGKRKFVVVIIAMTLLLLASSNIFAYHKSNAFYWWITQFDIDGYDKQIFEKLAVEKIYLRLFDVVYDEESKSIIPNQKIHINGEVLNNIEVVPVLFISNAVFVRLAPGELNKLTKKIIKLTDEIVTKNGIVPREIQLDYDWTSSTREQYFVFVKDFRSKAIKRWPGIIISCTLRLHQIKYKNNTGIPPADRGMLMLYNISNISRFAYENSIFNYKEFLKYSNYIGNYPMEFDVAVPCFKQLIRYLDGRVLGIISRINMEKLNNDKYFNRKNINVYYSKKEQVYEGHIIGFGEILKLETTVTNDVLKGLKLIKKNRRNGVCTIAIFDYNRGKNDSRNIEIYSRLFNCCNN